MHSDRRDARRRSQDGAALVERWYGRRVLKVLRLLSGALSFLYLIIVLNGVQLLSLLVLPFSRRVARRMNRWCARSIWGLWVLMAERQNKIDVRVTGDEVPIRENALLLPNHQSMTDVLLALCFAWRARRLGDLKWFVKDVVKYVPGPGFGMWFLDCIFVKRDWLKDRGNIDRLFNKYKTEKIPLFLVSFLEGTRLTKKKLAESQAFARERGHYVPKHTLVPRTKGFVFSMLGLGDHLDAVYDITFGYQGDRPPSLYECFAGDVVRLDMHVRRYPRAALPSDEEGLAEWALARFREKDELLEQFKTTGAFPGRVHDGKVTLADWLRSEDDLPSFEPESTTTA